MSPTSTEQNELHQPDAHAPTSEPNRDANNDLEVEDSRSFVQRNPLAKTVAILVVIAAVLGIGWYWWNSSHWESTDDAEIDGHIYPISARVSGQVIKVNIDDGQMVHKGDVLVVTDPTDYKVALDRAQADYQESQASAQAAQFGVPISSAGSSQQIRSASADMSSAQAGATSPTGYSQYIFYARASHTVGRQFSVFVFGLPKRRTIFGNAFLLNGPV